MTVETGSLDRLLQQGKVWQARRRPCSTVAGLSTGYPELDAELPGRGWQRGQLTELLYTREGSGELRLVLPALAQLSREGQSEREPGWLLWVDPPHIPYAPALAEAGLDLSRILVVRSNSRRDRLWCLEQALKSGCCSAVLGWLPPGQEKAIRRLQLAAGEGGAAGFLFRPAESRAQSSAAPCRLLLESQAQGANVTILKRRGGWALPAKHLSLGEERILPPPQPGRPQLRRVE